MSQIFKNLEKFRSQRPEVKLEPEVSNGEETASFKYAILDKDLDSPQLSVKIDNYDAESIKSLACILASLCNENFIFQTLIYIEQGFRKVNREVEFLELLEEIEKYKNKITEEVDKICVLPSELMGD
jgi:hypothetical protein